MFVADSEEIMIGLPIFFLREPEVLSMSAGCHSEPAPSGRKFAMCPDVRNVALERPHVPADFK